MCVRERERENERSNERFCARIRTKRNSFSEIVLLFRFDNRAQRKQRLQTDKFTLISEVLHKFIENYSHREHCYKLDAHA